MPGQLGQGETIKSHNHTLSRDGYDYPQPRIIACVKREKASHV